MIKTPKIPDVVIPLLGTAHQTDLDGRYTILGMDTEMLFQGRKGKAGSLPQSIWPHLEGFQQERVIDEDQVYDWHGDGYAFELCIAPAYCLEHVVEKIGKGMDGILDTLELKGYRRVKLTAPVMYSVPGSVVREAPDAVKRLGCMPSHNVYGDPGDPAKMSGPLTAYDYRAPGATYRTTGCHLHLSHCALADDEVLEQNLVKWADVLVGNAWNYVSPNDPYTESHRRLAYGRAGEYRSRKYPEHGDIRATRGVEYRVLPGTVITNPIYLTLMFNLYRTAYRFARTLKAPAEEITDISREAINTANKKLSANILNWLPFGKGSRQLLQHIKTVPPPVLTPDQWFDGTQNHTTLGHRKLAHQQGFSRAETDPEQTTDYTIQLA